jgi:hypothetical protein
MLADLYVLYLCMWVQVKSQYGITIQNAKEEVSII